MTENLAQGWCTDPYGLHEARWMSAGTPTKLVLDQGRESYDPAPQGEPRFAPEWFDGHRTVPGDAPASGSGTTPEGPTLRKVAARVLHPLNH